MNKAKMLKPAVSLRTLYGLGVGPGDPELITVKALKILQAAPVVAFPAGIGGKRGVAEQIIEPWLTPEQHRLPLKFPYVLNEQQLSAAWTEAAATVLPYLQRGDVAFACEGDVSFYGTFTYLAQAVQHQQPSASVKMVAGLSSPMAAAAAAHIPLTCQSDKLAILPALYSFNGSGSGDSKGADSSSANALESALIWADVIVLMKVSSVYSQVWAILREYGLLERSVIVEKATRTEEKIWVGLHNHPELQLPYFSLLIVQRKDCNIKQRLKLA